jgi:hypothetical protein
MKLLSALLFLIWSCLPLCATNIGLVPFSNESKYKGKWDLQKDIPRYIEKCLKKTYRIVPFDSLNSYLKKRRISPSGLNMPARQRQVAKHFKADFLIKGTIEEFLVRKIIVGEGKYGGMKNYLAQLKLKIKVYGFNANAVIYSDKIEFKKKDNLTAINLGRLSKDEALFDKLRTEKFGSEIFDQSIAGRMMQECCDRVYDIILKLPEPVARKGETKKLIKIAKIVDITETDVYINAGLDDQVEIGDVFLVYTKGDSIRDPDSGEFLGVSEKYIGQIRISFVEASHFSRAKVVKKKQDFKLKDTVRIEK